MNKQWAGVAMSMSIVVYVTLCGLAELFSTAGVFSFWHPALLLIASASLAALLIGIYEPPPLTRDEQDVLKRYRESL